MRLPVLASLAILFCLPTSHAAAAFPNDQIDAQALQAVTEALADPSTALGAADAEMRRSYDVEAPVAFLSLSELTSAAEVHATVLAVKSYQAFTAGGRAAGSLSVVVEVTLITDSSNGDVTEARAKILDRTIKKTQP